ncbi:hypothetical protein QRC94_003767 [Vibrio vulnificus]|uniref:hypothetical protein n=1 Tax=Vibrio vulnificus TaxID=672 RepID=UPI00294036DA|nr:hypothetical protein [Vibrio vulnificus]ELR8547947.1 hypothetical protein [Vibrio vulnificus]ELR8552701.1 hypothetical protein [Vibrio vulnificus]
MSGAWQVAILLPMFYEKVGKSAGGISRHFQFSTFKLGHDPDLIDETGSTAFIKDISDMSALTIKNVFYVGNIVPENVAWDNGRLIMKLEMPAGEISEPKRHSQTGIYDLDDDLIAVAIDLPDWLTPTEPFEIRPYINFPVE